MFGVSASGNYSKSKNKSKSSTSTSSTASTSGSTSARTGVGLGGLVGHFQNAAKMAKRAMDAAPGNVYQGPRVAGPSADTEIGYAKTRARALGSEGYLDQAMGDLSKTSAGREFAPKELLDLINQGGTLAQNKAFGTANRQFQGSGFGSPLHAILSQRAGQEAMGQTAIPALAGLYGDERARQEAAIRDMPGLYTETARAPGDLFREIGAEQEAREQAGIEGEMDRLAEQQAALDTGQGNYLNSLLGIGQVFKTKDTSSRSRKRATSKTKTKSKSKASSMGLEAGGSYGFT